MSCRGIRIAVYTAIFTLIAAAAPLGAGEAADFDGWQQIDTEYTRIIFEPHDSEYAREVAAFADAAYERVVDLVGYTPDTRVPVLLTNRTAWANGYYSPLPHRIVLFVPSPSERFMGSRTESWLRTLYTHELTHYVHLTARLGIPGLLSHVLGPDALAATSPLLPLWWTEGIAVYAESTLEPGGRGDAALFELRYRSLLLADSFWNRHEMRYAAPFPPSDRPYIGGYLFVGYLIERFGSEVFADINRWFARLPLLGIGTAIRIATGHGYSELYDDMLEAKEQEYRELSRQESPGQRALEHAPGNLQLPEYSRRGWIGYASTVDEAPGIVRYRGTEQLQVADRFATGGLSDNLSWSVAPDGEAAVIAKLQRDLQHPGGTPMAPQGYSELFLLNLRSGEQRQLTRRQQLYQPDYDGSTLVAMESVGSRYRLVRVSLDEGSVETIYSSPSGSIYAPQLSSDGRAVVAVEQRDGMSALVRILLDSGEREVLLPFTPAGIYRPRSGPDGGILFTSDIQGEPALYRYSDGRVARLLDDPYGVFGGEVHESVLLYATYRAEGYSLRSLPISELSDEEVPWERPSGNTAVAPPQPAGPGDTGDSAKTAKTDESGGPGNSGEYTARPFRDFPRPGLWLPYPDIQMNSPGGEGVRISPAVMGQLHSLTGRHSVSGSAVLHLPEGQPGLRMSYTHSRAWGSVSLSGASDLIQAAVNDPGDSTDGGGVAYVQARQNQLGIQVSRHVWQQSLPGLSRGVQGSLGGGYVQALGIGAAPRYYLQAQLRYNAAAAAAAAAFYGGSAYRASLGSQVVASRDFADEAVLPLTLQVYGGVAAQTRLPLLQHVMRGELDAHGFVRSTPGPVLLPRGEPAWQRYSAPIKLRGTLLYRLPLGLYDQWIPYGGITGLGASLYAQSAWYLGNAVGAEGAPSVRWEERLYTGIELEADMKLLMSGTIRPAVGLNVRLDPAAGAAPSWDANDFHLYIDLRL